MIQSQALVTNTFNMDALDKVSAVVAFKGRGLVMPKGIDGGEMLAWASADELLAHHLELASNAKAFWKDGFLLYTLWAMGDFCGIIPHGKRSTLYPYTRTGFYQFLHDHGRRRITGCRMRIPKLVAVTGAAVGPRKGYAKPLSAARCGSSSITTTG
jgi:hypothetical protein